MGITGNSNANVVTTIKRLTLKERFLRTLPLVKEDPLFLAYRADWLATLLLSEAPEGPFRKRAIEKAASRSEELRIRKPVLEIWNEKIQYNAQISGPHETTRTGCSKRPAQPLIPQNKMAGSPCSASRPLGFYVAASSRGYTPAIWSCKTAERDHTRLKTLDKTEWNGNTLSN
jgi:hypothetical protein